MAKNNFYGVKVGKTTGVFTSWAECEAQIKGVSGAIFKGFKTEEEAEIFSGKKAEKGTTELKSVVVVQDRVIDELALAKEEFANCEERLDAIFYTDGSYRESDDSYSYSYVCVTPNGVVTNCGRDKKNRLSVSRQISGEVWAVLEACEFSMSQGFSDIKIIHDLEGIPNYLNGVFNVDPNKVTGYFSETMKKVFLPMLNVSFKWVRAHRGIYFNTKADKLARNAENLEDSQSMFLGLN